MTKAVYARDAAKWPCLMPDPSRDARAPKAHFGALERAILHFGVDPVGITSESKSRHQRKSPVYISFERNIVSNSSIGVKRSLLHRIGAVGVALTAAASMAVIAAPTARADGFFPFAPTATNGSLIYYNNSCIAKDWQCYGVLVHWNVALSYGPWTSNYSNDGCVGGGQVGNLDSGYNNDTSTSWRSKMVWGDYSEYWEDNPCYTY